MPPPDPKIAAITTPDPALRPHRRPFPWLLVWSLAVAVIVAWLTMPGTDDSSQHLIRMQDSPTGTSLTLEQASQGLRLLHLSLLPAYPWILLAPYLLSFAARWRLESGRGLKAAPVLIAGAVAWGMASGFLNRVFALSRPDVIVFANVETRLSLGESARDGATPTQALQRSVVVRVGNGNSTNALHDPRTNVRHSLSAGVQDPLRTPLPSPPPGLPRIGDESLSRMHIALDPARRSGNAVLTRLLLDLFAYASLLGMAHALHLHRRLREREHRALALESSLTRARLHSLQAQLQPHFLFNTLNSVTALLREDPRRAEEMLVSLSELLRRALSSSERAESTLGTELELADSYVEIQRHRFGARLDFQKRTDHETHDCLVPTLLLQPLIENAIRHGVEPSTQPVRVTVEAHLVAPKRVSIVVRDNARAADPGDPARETASTGVGLSNLRARLDALYHGTATFSVHSPPPQSTHGFEVRMVLPVRVAISNPGHSPPPP